MPLRSHLHIRNFSRILIRSARIMGPTFVALAVAGATNVAHAQGTMDFSGATTLMSTFKTRFRANGVASSLRSSVYPVLWVPWSSPA